MRTLRIDSIGGASGDMILAGMISLGIKTDILKTAVASMKVDEFDITAKEEIDRGITGIRVNVSTDDHHHSGHSHHHHHRSFSDIKKLITESSLPEKTKELSISVFTAIAAAEGKIHGKTPEEVHFHEVGAMDSIIDIVGSCLALELLKIDAVTVSPLPLGSGTTTCAHGVIPVPAPATVEILKNEPVIQTDEPYELVTPTGAALLKTFKQHLPAAESGTTKIVADGFGLGHRKLNARANYLRMSIHESAETDKSSKDSCIIIETNIDDTIPEIIGAATEAIIDAGALDVYTTPVQMKKQRPATLLTVLCRPEDQDLMTDLIFRHTTTFGVRSYSADRTVLARRHFNCETVYGTIRIKTGSRNGTDITFSPEYDDCLKAAAVNGVAVRKVYDAAAGKINSPKD